MVTDDLYQLITRAITNTRLSLSIYKLPLPWSPIQIQRLRSRGRWTSRTRDQQDLRHRISQSLHRPRRSRSRSTSPSRPTVKFQSRQLRRTPSKSPSRPLQGELRNSMIPPLRSRPRVNLQEKFTIF